MSDEPSEDWADKYPNLFRPHPHTWGGAAQDYTIQLTLTIPADDLVVNTRLIAVEDGSVVVCTTTEGWRTLPGGSREQGEPVSVTAARELMEEAGCAPIGPVHWFASFTVTHTRPWKDWHPYPVSAWIVVSSPCAASVRQRTRPMEKQLSKSNPLNQRTPSRTYPGSTTADKLSWSLSPQISDYSGADRYALSGSLATSSCRPSGASSRSASAFRRGQDFRRSERIRARDGYRLLLTAEGTGRPPRCEWRNGLRRRALLASEVGTATTPT